MAISDYKAGDIELKDITLFNYRGAPIDIKIIMEEFTIFHDLYANGIQCEILVVDSNGLLEFMPIVGDETLMIKFRTPTDDRLRTYIFRVYKVDNKVKGNDRTDNYVIKGISQESINDRLITVQKSYTDLPADAIVKSIYNEYLKPNEKDYIIVKKKKLNIQTTHDNHHMVFTDQSPFKAINTMCMEGQVKSQGKLTEYDFKNKKIKEEEYIDNSEASNFVFYESYDGWNFKTLDSLLVQDPVEDYYFTNAKVEQTNKDKTIKKYQIINSLEYNKQFDTLESMSGGLFFNTVETIDPITKRFTVDNFTYNTDKGKISHLEKNRDLFSKESLFAKGGQSSRKYYMQSNIGENYNKQIYLSNAITTDPQIRNPREMHKWFKFDLASRVQLNNIVFTVGVPGNTDIEIGQVVNIHIPQNSGIEEYKKKQNLIYGNKFFVTAVRHTFNKQDNSFFTIFEAVKDVYAKKVIEETDVPIIEEVS
tara:strand:+ start:928 stop:2361 length:1434 start_codon:yes stop_codon:yes gene_type:complete